MSKPWVYIASPYTNGDVALNVRASMRAFDELLNSRLVVPFSPLLTHFQHLVFPRSYDDWLEYDLQLLERFDILLRLNATYDNKFIVYQERNSAGADAEELKFRKMSKPVCFCVEEVIQMAQDFRKDTN